MNCKSTTAAAMGWKGQTHCEVGSRGNRNTSEQEYLQLGMHAVVLSVSCSSHSPGEGAAGIWHPEKYCVKFHEEWQAGSSERRDVQHVNPVREGHQPLA